MTFDREPDLDNANVGIPEQKGKTESYQIGGFLFYVIGNSYEIPYYIKKPSGQDSFLLRLLRKIMGQEKKAW